MNKVFKLFNNLDVGAVASYHGYKVFKGDFLAHVALTRNCLPSSKYIINLCENRYHFLVAFAACVSLGKISLFPNCKVSKEINELSESYPDSHTIDDADIVDLCAKHNGFKGRVTENFDIDAQQIVAILFTSGTTGKAKKNPKTWGQLNESSIRVGKRLWPEGLTEKCIIATVPPQHMFGFETSIIYPLTLGVMVHDGHPFYPLDIQQAALEISESKIIITTPLHLKACISLLTGWSNIDSIISATSPLTKEVASKAEYIMSTNIFEIYGCSESGAIATRQTSRQNKWELLKDYSIETSEGTTLLKATGYDTLIEISDQIKIISSKFFYLLGRGEDLVKIGGKRGSLSGLTCKLMQINGVDDGVFFVPKEDTDHRVRLAVLVVSSTLNKEQIIELLAQQIDRVFLPRPIKVVDHLPYNKLGKLPLNDLIEMIHND